MKPTDTLTPIVTTSSVLGIKYCDGVLLVADTLASYGRMSRYKDIDRYISCSNNKTVMACSGEYSDYQMLQRSVQNLCDRDRLHMDGTALPPSAIASYVSRVMYQKRNKMDPFYLGIVVAGFNGDIANVGTPGSSLCGKPSTDSAYLGYIDMLGTFYADDIIATGLGRYFAITLLREKQRNDMTEAEARELLEDCMKILFCRDCAASNRVQFAKVTSSGVTVDPIKVLDSDWNFKAYTTHTISMDIVGSTW